MKPIKQIFEEFEPAFIIMFSGVQTPNFSKFLEQSSKVLNNIFKKVPNWRKITEENLIIDEP